jgi:LytTr DNA-binding domain
MIALLAKNRSLPAVAMLAAITVVALGLYCLGYHALQGHRETAINAFGWPLVNIIPFIFAFELTKRRGAVRRGQAAGAALLLSLLLGYALDAGWDNLGFEVLRRVPATMLLVAGLFWLMPAKLRTQESVNAQEGTSLRTADWIAAAGNYVEAHRGGRIWVVRQPFGQLAEQLGRHGFVRIHRSHIVRRDAIVRVENRFVLLDDGRRLPLGGRYRAALRGE